MLVARRGIPIFKKLETELRVYGNYHKLWDWGYGDGSTIPLGHIEAHAHRRSLCLSSEVFGPLRRPLPSLLLKYLD